MAEPTEHGESTTSKDPAAAAAIARAERAFAAGDHRTVRSELAALDTSHEEVRVRAAKLERAVSPDPALVAVLVGCLLVLFGVFAHYVLGVVR